MSMLAADDPTGGRVGILVSSPLTSTNKCCLEKALTDEAEDVSDGGHEDHQEVVEDQYSSSDEEVSYPAELFPCETQRGD